MKEEIEQYEKCLIGELARIRTQIPSMTDEQYSVAERRMDEIKRVLTLGWQIRASRAKGERLEASPVFESWDEAFAYDFSR